MLLLVFLLLFSFKLGLTEFTYNDATCSTTNSFNDYTLSPNTVTYFRSPNFPTTMQNASFCNARFYTDAQNYRLWFVIFNGNLGAFSVWNYYSESVTMYQFDADDYLTFAPSKNPIMFQFKGNATKRWTVFEGIVYTYTPLNICPFSQQTTNLEINRVIPIASSYDLDSTEGNSNCNWTFSINPDQLLKIAFKNFDSFTVLYLETDGYIADTFNKTVEYAYYYGSKSGIFYLYYIATSGQSEFFALVSVVDKNPNKPKQECQSTTIGISTTIQYLDYENGYKAFDSCTYQFLIPQNYETIIKVAILATEKGADQLSFTTETKTLVTYHSNDYFYLTSKANGTVFDFSADGNTQNLGFKLEQTMLSCQCSPSSVVIPCDGRVSISADISNTGYYCNNMACNFTISLEPTCNASYISLDYDINLRDNDNFMLLVDNQVFDNSTSSSSDDRRTFSKSQNISLQFSSGSPSASASISHLWRYLWAIEATTIYPNLYPVFYLTEDFPYNLLQLNHMKLNDAFVICSPTNDTLEMFLSDTSYTYQFRDFYLYDSNTLKNYVGDLNSSLIASQDDSYPRHIVSSSGCFTLYRNQATVLTAYIYMLFRMRNAHSKNCNNIMNVFSATNNAFIDARANDSGPCEITLLSSTGSYPVTQFIDFDLSSRDSFQVSSPINRKIYFTANSTDSWKGTTIYNPAISIKIPTKQSIFLRTYSKSEIDLTKSGNRGIFASPKYGGYETEVEPYPRRLYYMNGHFKNFNIQLNVKNMDGNGTVWFNNEDTNFTLTYQDFGGDFNFLIEYTVTLLTDTSTSTATTRQTSATITTLSGTSSTTTTTETTKSSTAFVTGSSSSTTSSTTTTAPIQQHNSSVSTILPLMTLLVCFASMFIKHV